MENLSLFDKTNASIIVNVVRYFETNNNFYLIFYPTTESAEGGYIKLYVAKIVNENGKYYTYPIDDDEEWNNFKIQIQKIVMNNRNGIPNENDADFTKLVGTTISDYKLFKLREQTTSELGQNKKQFPKVEQPAKPETVVEPVIPAPTEPVIEPVAPAVEPVIPVQSEPTVEPVAEPAMVVDEEVTPVYQETSIPVETVDKVQPNNDEVDKLKLENQQLNDKYEKLKQDFENMKNENLHLIDDNTRLTKKISDIKKAVL